MLFDAYRGRTQSFSSRSIQGLTCITTIVFCKSMTSLYIILIAYVQCSIQLIAIVASSVGRSIELAIINTGKFRICGRYVMINLLHQIVKEFMRSLTINVQSIHQRRFILLNHKRLVHPDMDYHRVWMANLPAITNPKSQLYYSEQ